MNNEKTQIELSVIICTRNRARKLATLIQCLGSQRDIEKLNWEIIIVDNNSTDNTKEVASAFSEGSNLRINYIFEPRTGLSYARNIGILVSKGSYILFIDDDVLIPKEFVSNAMFGVQEFPEFHIFGFRVLADWHETTKKPFWINFRKPFNLVQSFLPTHDLGKEPLQYPNRYSRNPIGAAFLLKKEIIENIGPFREDLGAGQSGLCEDTEFFWYAILRGHKILYWPYAAIYHPVLPDRPTLKYLHKWYFNLGKSLYLVKNSGRLLNEKKKPLLGVEGYISNKLPPIFEKVLLDIRVFNISLFLFIKFFIILVLLPLSIPLFLINRAFYFSTLLAKTLGEIKQATNKSN